MSTVSTAYVLKRIVPVCFVMGAGIELFMIKTGFCEYSSTCLSSHLCLESTRPLLTALVPCVRLLCGKGSRKDPTYARASRSFRHSTTCSLCTRLLAGWLACWLAWVCASPALRADDTVVGIESERRVEKIKTLPVPRYTPLPVENNSQC
jgi:hypothetical protein